MGKTVYLIGRAKTEKCCRLEGVIPAIVSLINDLPRVKILNDDNKVKEMAALARSSVSAMTTAVVDLVSQTSHMIVECSINSTDAGWIVGHTAARIRYAGLFTKMLFLINSDKFFWPQPSFISGMDQKLYPGVSVKEYADIPEAQLIVRSFLET